MSSSWRILVERWFREITDNAPTWPFGNMRALITAIKGYLAHHNN